MREDAIAAMTAPAAITIMAATAMYLVLAWLPDAVAAWLAGTVVVEATAGACIGAFAVAHEIKAEGCESGI